VYVRIATTGTEDDRNGHRHVAESRKSSYQDCAYILSFPCHIAYLEAYNTGLVSASLYIFI
jgi:hypothetical protein